MKQTNDFIEGLVIKEEPYGEKAKLLHILTAQKGVLKMKAPGASNLKSSTHSATGLFTFSEFSVAKGRNGYYTITGAVAKNNFFGIRNNIENFALACYFSTVVERVSVSDSSSSDILRLTLNCLYALSELSYDTDRVKSVFEIKLVSICGFSPDFDMCNSCGNKADAYVFDFFNFGLLCSKCKEQLGSMIKSPRYFLLTADCVSMIKFLCRCEIKQMFSAKISSESQSRFREFSQTLVCTILEQTPKTLSFYNQIKRSINDEKLRQKQENS